MLPAIKKFVEICAKTLPITEPIYEFGALRVPGQEEIADLRPFFPGKTYIGTDMREGLGVDMIIDLHNINIPSGSVGTAIMMETLEHVEYPRTAINNLHRILSDDGILILSSVMNFPIHDYPYDYWRFTPWGFKSLLKIFEFSHVDFRGRPDFPSSILGIASKTTIPIKQWEYFLVLLDKQKEHWDRFDKELQRRMESGSSTKETHSV